MDVRSSCISLDQTGGVTLGRAGLSTGIYEDGERLLGVDQGFIVHLWNGLDQGPCAGIWYPTL